jgi:hypothetical protein
MDCNELIDQGHMRGVMQQATLGNSLCRQQITDDPQTARAGEIQFSVDLYATDIISTVFFV